MEDIELISQINEELITAIQSESPDDLYSSVVEIQQKVQQYILDRI